MNTLPEPDWLRRRTTPGEPLLATATCPDTGQQYVFLARFPVYDADPFELLGACPQRAGQVPLAFIRHLADLGTHLAHPATSPTDLPDTFPTDEGHQHPTCPYGPTP